MDQPKRNHFGDGLKDGGLPSKEDRFMYNSQMCIYWVCVDCKRNSTVGSTPLV